MFCRVHTGIFGIHGDKIKSIIRHGNCEPPLLGPRGIPHTYRDLGLTPGRLMCVITPSGFEGFFEEIGMLSPQQQHDIPRGLEIAKQFGLEFLPPTGRLCGESEKTQPHYDNPNGITASSPRLARPRLPWVHVPKMETTSTRLWPLVRG